jgi:hypothetical protein
VYRAVRPVPPLDAYFAVENEIVPPRYNPRAACNIRSHGGVRGRRATVYGSVLSYGAADDRAHLLDDGLELRLRCISGCLGAQIPRRELDEGTLDVALDLGGRVFKRAEDEGGEEGWEAATGGARSCYGPPP